MTTNSAPAGPPRQRSRASILMLLLSSCLLVVILGIYLIGFFFVRDANDFSKRPVHFEWHDRGFALALGDLLPGRELRYSLLNRERIDHQFFELSTRGKSEAGVVYFISLMADVRIQSSNGIIAISELSPIAHLYRRIDFWFYRYLRFSPWGNAGYR